jgi:CubicO group peptidase (beta-lactamase class C family)
MDEQACTERITELVQPGRLRHELERALGGAVTGDVVVGLRSGGRTACAASAPDLSRAPIRVGCIAKLLTAMLARRAFQARRIAPDELVSDLLSARAARDALRGITVRQLLEHTHGLDDSMLAAAPIDSLGRIDTDALALELRTARPLASPGALYSYGNAGACVVAALLERVGSRSYAAQLAEALESLGTGVVGSAEAVCPATGGELALDPSVLLDLVAQATFVAPDVWPDDECAGDYGFATPLSGWNPLERGIYLGWKYHGAGWLGHQSAWPGHSVLVRAHPRRRLALVAACSHHSAAVLAARVFGAHLPELFNLKAPARTNTTPEPPVGTFSSAAWRVHIREVGDELELRVRRNDDSVELSAALRAMAPGLWLTRPVLSAFPHVELVRTTHEHLWNGRFVLRRPTANHDFETRKGAVANLLADPLART